MAGCVAEGGSGQGWGQAQAGAPSHAGCCCHCWDPVFVLEGKGVEVFEQGLIGLF